MAFDKCTLLSSQGSDAPAFRPLGLRCRATSLSYLLWSASQIGLLQTRGSAEAVFDCFSPERSGAPRFSTVSPARRATSLSYPSHVPCQFDRGDPSRRLRWRVLRDPRGGTSVADPRVRHLEEVTAKGVVRCLRGRGALPLRSPFGANEKRLRPGAGLHQITPATRACRACSRGSNRSAAARPMRAGPAKAGTRSLLGVRGAR